MKASGECLPGVSQRVASRSYVAGLVRSGRIRPKKRLGQSFLIESHIVDRIVAAAGPLEGRPVVEIGAGLGVLTAAVAVAGADPVVAVEKDPTLTPYLRENTAAYDSVRVVQGDALDLELRSLAGTEALVVGNLPYSLTSPLLIRLLAPPVFWPQAVVMVQSEVAGRILAPPGGKEYGALTLAVAQVAVARIAFQVSRTCFYPRPEVDSAVVVLERRDTPAGGLDPDGLARLRSVIRAAFGQRRKTVANALAAGLDLDRAYVSERLLSVGVDPGRRGETLTLDDYVAVEEALRLGGAGLPRPRQASLR